MSEVEVTAAPVTAPSTKFAKSMTGHIYEYAVHTAGEFIQKVSACYNIPRRFLSLLEPDEYQEIDEKTGEPTRTTRKYPDEVLQEHIIYALLMDTPHPVLLDWIDPTMLNHHLRLENPSYHISDSERNTLIHTELDYLALHPGRIDIVTKHYERLAENGWRRLFTNTAALPFLEEHYEQTIEQFYELAPLLAMNTEVIPVIERLLQDDVPMRRPDIFWRNLSRNENAIALLELYPDRIHLPSLSENPSAIPRITKYIEENEVDWRNLSANPGACPLFFRFPHLVDKYAVHLNPNPDVVKWIRLYLSTEEIKWDMLCRYPEPEFIAFVEEHLDRLTSEGWGILCYNPSAIHLLKAHPERIHWTLLSCNPSADVIPMIEEYLSSASLSDEGPSLIGMSFIRHRIRERYQEKDLWHEDNRLIVNRGALSLHPHALPLLKRVPDLIYWNTFSVRPDIYEEVSGCLL